MYIEVVNGDPIPFDWPQKGSHSYEWEHVGPYCTCGWPMELGAPKCVQCLQTEGRARWEEATAHITGYLCLQGVHHEGVPPCDCEG